MIFKAILFGMVQGVTEFFPISSSGHLLILHRLVDMPFADELAFDVSLHFAALLALAWVFRADISHLAVAWARGLFGGRSPASNLSWFIILASLPALLIGYFFGSRIEAGSRSVWLVIFNLAAVGALMIMAEKKDRAGTDLDGLSLAGALMIGFCQVLALFPGVSRSGITIIAGMFSGLKRQASLKFSFYLAMPVLLGAGLSKLPDLFSAGADYGAWPAAAAGFAATLLVSLAAIKYLMRLLEKYSLRPFAYYRLALAAVAAVIFYGLA